MKTRFVMIAGVVALFTMPLSAQAQGIGDVRGKEPAPAIMRPDRSAGSWAVLSAG